MIALIAAVGRNNELGKSGGLVWHLPGDLDFFKEMTMGHPILMGSKTFESLPGLLPGREHYVLTRHPDKLPPEVHAVPDFEKFIKEWQAKPETLFVIGGAMVYWETMKYADRLYLTEIDATDNAADIFFPEFNKSEWDKQILRKGNDHGIAYTHALYIKKS